MNRDDETRAPEDHGDDARDETRVDAAAEARTEDHQPEGSETTDESEQAGDSADPTAAPREGDEPPAPEATSQGEPGDDASAGDDGDGDGGDGGAGNDDGANGAGDGDDDSDDGDSEAAAAEAEAPQVTWEDLGLEPERAEKLRGLGYPAPMEVQAASYALVSEGRDIVVQSRTGSGKTAAFGLPLVERLRKEPGQQPRVLALMPTRELAIQVADEIARIAEGTGVTVCALYGGAAISPQIRTLEQGVHIVCGTPGRVLDHIRRRTLKVDAIDTLVLDEADEMLSMGFYEELSAIISRLPARKQTLLFSATMPEEVQRLANKYQHEPERLILSDDFIGAREVHHVYYLVSGLARARDLMRVLEEEKVESAIIFCNTREETANLAGYLQDAGLPAEAISSDFSQAERERTMARMREGKTRFLVATDIAARGIDIAELGHVINYRFPENADIYIHRTGRTGRAGKSGVAISLVSPQELGDFYYMKLTHGITPEERFLPTPAELAARREGERYAALASRIDELDESIDPEFINLTRRIWHSLRGEEIVAFLLQEYFARHRAEAARPSRRRARRPSRSEKPGTGGADRGDGADGGDGAEARERSERRPRRGDSRRDDRRGRRDRDEERRPRAAARRDRGRRRDERDGDGREGRSRERGSRERGSRSDGPKRDEGTKLYLNIGRNAGVKPSTLIDFLVQNAGIDRQQVYRIQIRDRFSFVGVDPEAAEAVVAAANGKALGEQSVTVELARPPRK